MHDRSVRAFTATLFGFGYFAVIVVAGQPVGTRPVQQIDRNLPLASYILQVAARALNTLAAPQIAVPPASKLPTE